MSNLPENIAIRPRARARDLLKAYYTSNTESVELVEQSPLDIDSEVFDSSQYLAQFIKNTHLVEIIKKDNSLVSDIREIDGNMQTLVYENYGQFISATDTIKLMKNSVDSMDIEFDQLCKVIDCMSTKTAQVHESMSSKRNQISSLYNTHDLLNKLNFIFELPEQLKKCLKSSNWEGAAFFYNRSAHLIDKYKDQTMFKSIQLENKSVLSKIVVKLKELVFRESDNFSEIAHRFELLISLDQLPPFDIAVMHLSILKKRISAMSNINPLTNMNQVGPCQATQMMISLIREILAPYPLIFDSFQTLYFHDSFLIPFSQTKESCINHYNQMDQSHKEKLKVLLEEQHDTFCLMLFDKLSVVLPLYKCKEENFKLSICFESLNLVHQEIDRYVTMNSLYKLDQRLSLFTIAYFDGIIQSIYGNITTEIHKIIINTNDESAVPGIEFDVIKRIQQLHEQAVSILKMFLEDQKYKSSLAECMKLAGPIIRAALFESFKKIEMTDLLNPFFKILLSRILQSISKVVPAIYANYPDAFLYQSITQSNTLQKKTIEMLKFSSNIILDLYMKDMIDIVSSEMSAYLAFMESNSHQKPVAVSSLILQLTSIMIHIGRDFTRIYPERRKRNQITNSTSNRSQNSSKDPYDGLFDKLFSDKNIYFVALERNYMALQAHLYMSLFKFMLEEIRNCVVFEWALGQFEIDFEFLKRTLGEILNYDARLFNLVLDISSCFTKRCVDGKRCDAKEVGRLVVVALPKTTSESP